jgi:hypothetical protein
MYREKSKIIGQIQSYHKQVAELYYGIYEKIEDNGLKSLIYELYEHEKDREEYLERHKKIAEAMDCWLDFPCEKLSDQISECFKNLNLGSDLKMEDLLKIELHFDDCLIKFYYLLASENALSETAANIFYYMLKKTRKEQGILSGMLTNSGNILHLKLSDQSL